MPVYEYKCFRCKEEFEVEQKITDKKLSKHSEIEKTCDGELERLISNASFLLKGTGWTPKSYPSR